MAMERTCKYMRGEAYESNDEVDAEAEEGHADDGIDGSRNDGRSDGEDDHNFSSYEGDVSCYATA